MTNEKIVAAWVEAGFSLKEAEENASHLGRCPVASHLGRCPVTMYCSDGELHKWRFWALFSTGCVDKCSKCGHIWETEL